MPKKEKGVKNIIQTAAISKHPHNRNFVSKKNSQLQHNPIQLAQLKHQLVPSLLDQMQIQTFHLCPTYV